MPFRPLTLAALAFLGGTLALAQPTATAPTTKEDGTVVLSPFQVNSSADRGYQAISTLSGTRLNSALEDLGASLSVVTRQQLEDTAAVDINDIFKYELNTEGTFQFTNFSVDRGVVTDGVQNDPQGSTRVRGLSAANNAANGFTTSLPFDTYDVEAVEISRGPNSTVFGLGATGGASVSNPKNMRDREATQDALFAAFAKSLAEDLISVINTDRAQNGEEMLK